MSDVRCIDAGSGACPCPLAAGGCPACPALAGGECACEWSGVCVLAAVEAGQDTTRRPALATRVRAVEAVDGGCALVQVDWPATALPSGSAYCLVKTDSGEQAAPVIGITESPGTGIVFLMKGQLPKSGDRVEMRGPFPPNGPR